VVFLIADDNPRMRQSFKQTIMRHVPDDHKVYEAADGGEAIRLYEEYHPDWVLMDIKMEPMDGIEASKSILRVHPGAKIIILTNYDDPAYRKAAQEAGVRDYILKEQFGNDLKIVFQ